MAAEAAATEKMEREMEKQEDYGPAATRQMKESGLLDERRTAKTVSSNLDCLIQIKR